jgi:putative DNA primase/helicase
VVCFTPDDWSVPDLPNPFGDSEPYQPKGGNMAHVARAWVKAGHAVAVPVTPDRVSHYSELLSDTGAVILPIPEPLTWLEVEELAALPQQLADLWQQVAGEPLPTADSADSTDSTTLDIDSELERLASLSAVQYERERTDAAKALGMRASALDKIVRGLQAERSQQDNSTELFPDVRAWHEPVDGAALLDDLTALVHRHIACQDATAHATALWIVFTWCIDAMQIAPIACITAPEKRCGKTQLLTLIGMLCYQPLPASNITAAALFRSIEKWKPTLLIDEADAFLRDNEELRGVINAGHSRQNAFVIRTTGDNHEPTRFNVWGAKAISGIGHLSDTLKDRSILLELRRKQANEQRERLRHTDPHHIEQLKQQLCRWSADHIEQLRSARPALPDALNDRAQDNWESLLAIADLVGGHWPNTARRAALTISGIDTAAPSINEELLGDIQAIFERTRQTKIFSTDLLEYLCADEEAAWATWNKGRPMTARQLSKRLEGFGVVPKNVRIGTGQRKGYDLTDFHGVFERYVPKTDVLSVPPSHNININNLGDKSNVPSSKHGTDELAKKTLQNNVCSGGTDRKGGSRKDSVNVADVAANVPTTTPSQATPLQPLQWSMDV